MSDFLLDFVVRVSEQAPSVGFSLGACFIYFKLKGNNSENKTVSIDTCESHVSEFKTEQSEIRKDLRKIAESVARIEGKLERRH